LSNADFSDVELSRSLAVSAVTQVQHAFLELLALEDMDENDGTTLGATLMAEIQRKSKRPLEAKLKTFVDRTAALRSVVGVFPWFEVLLLHVLRNRLRLPKTSSKALAVFEEKDARDAGRGLANALITNVSAGAAVDEWVGTYPALGELEQR
jgi:hypothetical protein